jgi:hypothetical protein
MAAEIGTATYERPSRILRTRREWLIVARWGAEGQFATLSSTQITPDAFSPAPAGLAPRRTCLGVLLSEEAGDGVTAFLLVRRLPQGVTVRGTFSPADGFLRLYGWFADLRLTGMAFHAHSHGWPSGGRITRNPDGAGVWHIEAARRPWRFECAGSGDQPAMVDEVAYA